MVASPALYFLLEMITLAAHEGLRGGVACLAEWHVHFATDIDPDRSYEHERHEQPLLIFEGSATCKSAKIKKKENKMEYTMILNASIEGQVAEQVETFTYLACINKEDPQRENVMRT